MRQAEALPIIVALMAGLALLAGAEESPSVVGPVEYVYASPGGRDLRAFVFRPAGDERGTPRSSIVVFHGGGWCAGEPEWSFARARHFAERGMVGVAAEYRLSDRKTITPLEAMADARAVIRWMRSNADTLGIDVGRVAAYGWSAGAHLAACAAIFDDVDSDTSISCVPNALVLVSPAVSVESDGWFQRLLLSRVRADEFSPDEHVRPGMPPAIILQGRADTVTPLAGAERFCDRMLRAGNRCDLHIYDGVGHLFTPAAEPDDGMPNPDPNVQTAAYREADEFLEEMGFMEKQGR